MIVSISQYTKLNHLLIIVHSFILDPDTIDAVELDVLNTPEVETQQNVVEPNNTSTADPGTSEQSRTSL